MCHVLSTWSPYYICCFRYEFEIFHSFIHLSSSKRRLIIMVLHLSLSSATLFITPKFFKFVHFIISSVHVSLGLPLSLFPQTFPSKIHRCEFPLDLLGT